MIKYKIDILNELKSKGYEVNNSYKGRVLTGTAIDYLRKNKMVGITTLDKICKLLDMQPGDLIEYIPDKNDE